MPHFRVVVKDRKKLASNKMEENLLLLCFLEDFHVTGFLRQDMT